MADSTGPATPSRNPLKRLYHWVLSWSDRPFGAAFLFGLAVAESFIFPIPPDPLLIALILGKRKKAWLYAALCTAGSVIGGALGYLIGMALWDATRDFWFSYVFREAAFERVTGLYREYDAVAVFAAAFSPIPYKVFTIAGGVAGLSFPVFLFASLVGRAGRFFLVAGLFYWIGPRIAPWIEKWFNTLAFAFAVLLILSFWILFQAGGASEPADAARLRPGVEASTGWEFKSVPVYERIDRGELLRHLESKLSGEPGRRLEAFGRAFHLLGALPEGYSLVEGMKKAYSEEILALYDVEEAKIFLVKEALERQLTPQEKAQRAAGRPILRDITLAHEMVHALQHQHNPNLDLVESEDPDLDDVKVALHAFVEGEATIHGLVATGAAAPRYSDLAKSLEAGARGKYADEPPLIRRALYFPYITGARHLALKVEDDIRGTAPRLHGEIPLSTEHLLHGRTAQDDPPSAVFLPDLSELFGEGVRLALEGVLGEAYLVPILGSDGDRRSAPASRFRSAVRWGGDRIHLYEKEGGAAPGVVLLTVWDDFESTEHVMKRLERAGLPAVRKGRTVAVVAGRPAEEARKIGEAAIERGVVRPFRSLEELRSLRAEFTGN